MAFTMKATSGSGGGTEKAPVGNHMAVLVGVFEMGTQEETFSGKTLARSKVYLAWELVNEKMTGTNQNHVIGCALTQSLNEKATLRKFIESRLGRKFGADEEYDVSRELGQPCMLNVVANDNGYPRVEGVAALPKGIPVPKPSYSPVAISLEEFRDEGKEIPEWVPWLFGSPLEDHIKACEEIGGAKPVKGSKAAPSNDPVPF